MSFKEHQRIVCLHFVFLLSFLYYFPWLDIWLSWLLFALCLPLLSFFGNHFFNNTFDIRCCVWCFNVIDPGFINFPWQLLCEVTWVFFSFSSILFSSSIIFPSNLVLISITISFCQCLFSSFSIVHVGQHQKQSGRCRTLYSLSVISIHSIQ